jgi:hypothetical protein
MAKTVDANELQDIRQSFLKLLDRMAAQNAGFSDEEVAADVVAARRECSRKHSRASS